MSGPRTPFSIIVATTPSGGIGKNGTLPWKKLKGDMAFFKKTTSETADASMRNALIMGRKTYESIPARFRPLPDRLNVVLTRSPDVHKGLAQGNETNVTLANSLDTALDEISKRQGVYEKVENVFVIGGGQIYKEAVSHPSMSRVLVTEVETDFECDTFFKVDKNNFNVMSESEPVTEDGITFKFVALESKSLPWKPAASGAAASAQPSCPPGGGFKDRTDPSHEEWQYLDLIRQIIDTGVKRGDRTGTGTLSKFGATMRFNLRDDVFPLLTTKRVFWRGVAEELLWFVSGSTNANELAEKKIHIWDGNGSREFLDKRGFPEREVGDLGPVYGFQWRHFGAEYKDMHADYTGQGVDQLQQCINLIKNDPNSRRILISAWNPKAQPLMALPPCHMFAQFFVANGELSCMMYQRSADMGLGVPFNIASYSLLTRMMAQVCGLKAGEFIHTIGDAHVYSNHVEPLKEQLLREPREFPKLKINPAVTDIDGFKYEDFTIEGYKPHKRIAMKMAV